MNGIIRQQNQIAGAVSEELRARFISYLDASKKTVETYSRNLKQFFVYLNDNQISTPTRDTVLSYKRYLLKRYKSNTVQNYIIAVRLFFQWTEQENIYPDIAKHIKGVRISKEHRKDYLSAGQIKQILARIDRDTEQGRRDYALFVLMVCDGLRDIEISRAEIKDLRTLGENTVLTIQGKGHTDGDSYVKISEGVERAIRDSLKDRQNAENNAPLFCSLSNNSYGKSLTTRSISGIIKSRMKDAGFNSERLTAHSLRHTAVTLALLGGNSIQEVQQFARHQNIATTMIYSHELDRAKNNCNDTITQAVL